LQALLADEQPKKILKKANILDESNLKTISENSVKENCQTYQSFTIHQLSESESLGSQTVSAFLPLSSISSTSAFPKKLVISLVVTMETERAANMLIAMHESCAQHALQSVAGLSVRTMVSCNLV